MSFFQKTIQYKIFRIFLFLLVFSGLFLFFGENKAKADAEPVSQCLDFRFDTLGVIKRIDGTEGFTPKQCVEYCEKNISWKKQDCGWTPDTAEANVLTGHKIQYASKEKSLGCSAGDPSTWLMCFLTPFLYIVKYLFFGAIVFFKWIADAKALSYLLDMGGFTYKMWAIVRDLLNMLFILILLFSAFATIFQVAKYNYKKILLILIIMALLVNFSYPISRVIIDASNVAMYSIAQGTLGDENYLEEDLLNGSGIKEFFHPGYSSTALMLMAIIFLAILTITLFAFAILLFIRGAALVLLIIFSPIGFVGNIIPGFEKIARDWWSNLFKYAFFGPIMMLGLYVSIEMMKILKNYSGMQAKAASVSKEIDISLLTTLSFFVIPIILLWATMGIAQKMSIAGAEKVTGKAKSILKKTGMMVSGGNFLKNAFTKFKDERKKRSAMADKTALSSRLGRSVGKGFNRGQDAFWGASEIIPGSKAARNRYNAMLETESREKIEEARKDHDTKNMSEEELRKLSTSGDKFEKAAAIIELATRGLANVKDIENIRQNFRNGFSEKDTSVVRELINAIRDYDPVSAYTKESGLLDGDAISAFLKSNKFDPKKLGSNSLGNAEFIRLAFEENALGAKDLLERSKKSQNNKLAIQQSLGDLAKIYDSNKSSLDQDIQFAYFAHEGKLANENFAENVFSRMDKETAANIQPETIREYGDVMTASIKQNQIKNIAYEIKNDKAAKDFINKLRSSNHENFIKSNPDLANF